MFSELNSPPVALPVRRSSLRPDVTSIPGYTPRSSGADCESCGRRRSVMYDVSVGDPRKTFYVCEDCHPIPNQ